MSSSSSSNPGGSSSSSSSGSSSSSSSNECGICEWEFDDFTGEWQNVKGCDGSDCICSPPAGIVTKDRAATECKAFSNPFPSSSTSFMRTARVALNRAALNTVQIRLPNIYDPLAWYSYTWPVNGPWSMFRAPNYGWAITFLRAPNGPPAPIVVPSLLPTNELPSADRGLSVSVSLPEATGFNQYWVTVLEEHRWAQLQTAQWTVIFMKLAS